MYPDVYLVWKTTCHGENEIARADTLLDLVATLLKRLTPDARAKIVETALLIDAATPAVSRDLSWNEQFGSMS